MALLRLLCFPLATHLSIEHQSPLSSLQNPHRQSFHPINNLSFRMPPSSFHFLPLSLAHTPNVGNKKSANLTLIFASTSFQEQVNDSSPENVSTEGQETEAAATEEFSRTRLIAQNVPWTSTREDIRSLFERHGKVLDVELSMHNMTRNRGLAFVEMGSEEEALAALDNLQSHEFEGRILKLEYARPKKKKTPLRVQLKPGTWNLFVANLPFEARSKDLREFFDSGSGSVVSAEVMFYDTPRKSAGYGFASFESKKEAEAALSEFQGKIFMGRAIRVARSRQFFKQPVESASSEQTASSELSVSGTEADTAD